MKMSIVFDWFDTLEVSSDWFKSKLTSFRLKIKHSVLHGFCHHQAFKYFHSSVISLWILKFITKSYEGKDFWSQCNYLKKNEYFLIFSDSKSTNKIFPKRFAGKITCKKNYVMHINTRLLLIYLGQRIQTKVLKNLSLALLINFCREP